MNLELNTSKQKLLGLTFDRFPQSNLFIINKKILVILNSKIKARKGPNQKKIDLKIFGENILL